MVTQEQIIEYLEKREGEWVSLSEIMVQLDTKRVALNKKILKLTKFGFCTIIVDGRRNLVKYKRS